MARLGTVTKHEFHRCCKDTSIESVRSIIEAEYFSTRLGVHLAEMMVY